MIPLLAFSALFQSLDPTSVRDHLAYYELYSDTPDGEEALKRAYSLLGAERGDHTLPQIHLDSILSLIQGKSPNLKLDSEQLSFIDTLSNQLGNRKLKGYAAKSTEEVLALPDNEIDLARGLLLEQLDDEAAIRSYEAMIDMMALQIRARLSENSTPEQMIAAINTLIFHELQFRFPPHSIHAKEIDLYTFLPSVLDGREGVCLGVSILYLAIAQRLELALEIITPPGHIYIRHNEINIETTARGIHLPSEVYLGIDTRHLQTRNIREVIGLAFFNQASVAWGQGKHKETVKLYEVAKKYMGEDPLLNMFLSYNYLFTNQTKKGRALLEKLRGYTFDHSVSAESIPEDFLLRRVNAEGIKTVYLHVDESRDSILEKQKKLQKVLRRYPKFRAGIFHLAVTHLQLNRTREALEILQSYHDLDPTNATVEYYLTTLSLHRLNYPEAKKHLDTTISLTKARDHSPKALTALRKELSRLYPSS